MCDTFGPHYSSQVWKTPILQMRRREAQREVTWAEITQLMCKGVRTWHLVLILY